MGIKIALILSTMLLLTGCFTTTITTVDPILSSMQERIIHKSGNEFVASEKKNIVAFGPISAIYSEEDNSPYQVAVHNKSSSTMDFSTDNIRVTYDGKPIHVYTYEQVIWALDMQQRTQSSRASSSKMDANVMSTGFGRALTALAALSSSFAVNDHFSKLKKAALHRVQIPSGQSYNGIIMIGKIKATEQEKSLIVTIEAGIDTHEIQFHVIRQET